MKQELLNMMQLRSFIRVVDHGSVSKASEVMLRAQSVVTRAIHDLESRLDVQLFERHANGMLLTAYGKCILPRARRVLAELATIPAMVGQPPVTVHEQLYLLYARRLEIFVKLCETQHMQTVANMFGLSQPAISGAVKVLEGGTGKVLFERTAQGLKPTRTSLDILMPIRRALNEVRRIEGDISALKGSLSGAVMIGALPLGRTRILPQAISDLLCNHPGVRVATNESPFDMLALELRAGDVDFIFGALRSSGYASDLIGEELLKEEMVVLVRRGHPLLSQPVQASDLLTARWILPRAATPARQLLEDHFSRQGSAPPVPMVETGDLAVIRGLLLRTDMLAAVSEHQLEHEIASGELVPLALPLQDTRRAIGLIYRANGLHSPAAEALITQIREAVRQPG